MPGIVAMAATDKGVVYEGAFGKRELGKDAPMTLSTPSCRGPSARAPRHTRR